VLLSHAGVSNDFSPDLHECGGDLDEFARRVNDEFSAAVQREIRTGDDDDLPVSRSDLLEVPIAALSGHRLPP
jgi:hypothetical protein